MKRGIITTKKRKLYQSFFKKNDFSMNLKYRVLCLEPVTKPSHLERRNSFKLNRSLPIHSMSSYGNRCFEYLKQTQPQHNRSNLSFLFIFSLVDSNHEQNKWFKLKQKEFFFFSKPLCCAVKEYQAQTWKHSGFSFSFR